MDIDYRDIATDALKGHGADYCEVRIETTESTRVMFRGEDLEPIKPTSSLGGAVRACINGAWAFSSFNDVEGLRERVADTVRLARILSPRRGAEKTQLAEVEPHVEVVPPHIVKDPGHVALADKVALAEHYNDLIMSQAGITSTNLNYGDNTRRVTFCNSEGANIVQEHVHVMTRISAEAARAGDVQQAGFSIGALGDYGVFEGLDGDVVDAAKRAAALLDAEKIDGRRRTVILDPILAGVFVHEAFGHLSEGDNFEENDKLETLMPLGRDFGNARLNFTDGGALAGMRGSYRYDDEGTPSTITPLVREGKLVGRLHSRETAGKKGKQSTGNARAISHRFPPIVRMTNTFIEKGEATFDDLLEGVDDGLYVKNWYGGMTQHEMFTFSSGEAYMVRNGEVQEAVKPVLLTGNLFTTLKDIDAVAGDGGVNQGGGCGKNGQMPLPVANGGPHIRIRDLMAASA